MKSLSQYIKESEEAMVEEPLLGDYVGIELSEDSLLESCIVDIVEDGVVIEVDDHGMRLLESCGCTLDEFARYGAVNNSPGMGFAVAEEEDFESSLSEILNRAGLIPENDDSNDPLMGKAVDLAPVGAMDEAYTVTRGIDRERYQERQGLEGPFSTKSGKVVYYDKVEGKYYDPDTDMYIEYSDWQTMNEAEYQGRKVPLGKPMAGDVKKSKVYVKGPKGNVVKVNFGDKNMRIKKSNPGRRKNFRARHNCDNPGPRWKARYWSCRAW